MVPPPENLIPKSVFQPEEPIKTGGFSLINVERLWGKERVEKMVKE